MWYSFIERAIFSFHRGQVVVGEGNGSLFLRFEASLFIITKGRTHILYTPYGARRLSLSTASTSSYFNPRAPHGARQQRCTKMHPAFAAKATNIRRGGRKMRPFSTDWWGKTRRFSPPCRCEPPGDLLGAWPSPKGSLAPRAGRSACSRNARSSFRTAAPDNKTADCPAGGP